MNWIRRAVNQFLRQQPYRGNTALLHSSFCLAALSQTGLSFIVADGKTQTCCSIMDSVAMHWGCSCLIYRPATIECHSFCFLSSTLGNKSWASLYEEETPAVLLQLRSLISTLMCIYILTAVPDIFGLCWANHLGRLFTGCIQKIYVLHFPDWHKTHLLVRPRGLSYCSAKK